MSEALSKTLHGDFDSVFHEVTQPEKVAWTTEGNIIHLASDHDNCACFI